MYLVQYYATEYNDSYHYFQEEGYYGQTLFRNLKKATDYLYEKTVDILCDPGYNAFDFMIGIEDFPFDKQLCEKYLGFDETKLTIEGWTYVEQFKRDFLAKFPTLAPEIQRKFVDKMTFQFLSLREIKCQ